MPDNRIHQIVEIAQLDTATGEILQKKTWDNILAHEMSLINTDLRKLNRHREHDPGKVTIYRSPHASIHSGMDSPSNWYMYTLFGIDQYRYKVKYTVFVEDHPTTHHTFTFKS